MFERCWKSLVSWAVALLGVVKLMAAGSPGSGVNSCRDSDSLSVNRI